MHMNASWRAYQDVMSHTHIHTHTHTQARDEPSPRAKHDPLLYLNTHAHTHTRTHTHTQTQWQVKQVMHLAIDQNKMLFSRYVCVLILGLYFGTIRAARVQCSFVLSALLYLRVRFDMQLAMEENKATRVFLAIYMCLLNVHFCSPLLTLVF